VCFAREREAVLSNRVSSKRTDLARGAVDAAVAALASLPDSDEKSRLLVEAESCARAIQSWPDRPPTSEEREAMMKRVLRLHVAVAALQREAAVAALPADAEPPEEPERPTNGPEFDLQEYASASDARLGAVPRAGESDVTVERMRESFARGQLEEALSVARSLLDAVPLHAEARLTAARCTEALEHAYEAELGGMSRVPVLAASSVELARFTLDDQALAILHHVDGATPTGSVLRSSGLPRFVAMRALTALCRRGIVSLQ